MLWLPLFNHPRWLLTLLWFLTLPDPESWWLLNTLDVGIGLGIGCFLWQLRPLRPSLEEGLPIFNSLNYPGIDSVWDSPGTAASPVDAPPAPSPLSFTISPLHRAAPPAPPTLSLMGSPPIPLPYPAWMPSPTESAAEHCSKASVACWFCPMSDLRLPNLLFPGHIDVGLDQDWVSLNLPKPVENWGCPNRNPLAREGKELLDSLWLQPETLKNSRVLPWQSQPPLLVHPAIIDRSCLDRQRFFSLSLDLLCTASFDGYFLQLNSSWERALGYSVDSLLAQKFLDLVHPDDLESTLAELAKLNQGDPTLCFENRYRCENGEYIWLSWVATPYVREQVIYAVARDVTDRKNQEKRLRLMERAINHASNGIIITDATDPQNPAIYVNAAVQRVTGYTPQDILGHNCRLFQSHDRHQPELNLLRQAIDNGQECKVVLRNYCRDGSLFWNELHIAPIYDESQHLTHFIGIQTDITEQKNFQIKLLDSEFHLRTIINTISDGLLVVDQEGKILFCNPAAEQIFGRSRTQLQEQEFGLPFAEGKWVEVTIRNPQRLIMTEMTTTPVVWQQKKAFLVSLRDVTDRNLAEEALHKKQKQFRLIFELAPTGMALASIQGQFVHVNPALCEMLDYEPTALEKLSIQDITHPEDLSLWQGAHHRLLWDPAEGSMRLEQRFIAHTGRIVHTILQVALLRDDMEEPIQLITEFVDITNRKQAEAALLSSEQFLRSIFNGIEEAIFVLDVLPGDEFRYVSLNFAYEKMTGLSSDQVRGKRPEDVLEPAWAEMALSHYRTCLYQGDRLTYEEHVVFQGQSLWWMTKLTPLRNSQGVTYRIIGTSIDMTARKQMENALRQSEHRYRQMVETATEGIWLLDQDYCTSFVNRQTAEMLGYTPKEMRGKSLLEFIRPKDAPAAAVYLRNGKDGNLEPSDFQFVRRDGTSLWAIVSASPLLNEQGDYTGALAMLTDITERRQAEEKMRHMALYDALTQLPNRTLFLDRLSQAIYRAHRHKNFNFAVLFLDLDRFKVINDSLGHSIGDELLVAFAELVQSLLRPTDTLARLGGDEFTILLEDLGDASDTNIVAERINSALIQPFIIQGYEVFTNVSIGIAFGNPSILNPETLLRDADTAMYTAKSQGKGCHAVFDAQMHQQALDRLHLELDLRRALDRKELSVYYQPIVSLTTGKLMGFEALVRWQHATQGLVPPDRFIPIAEETGLIIAVGQYVLTEACRQTQFWQENFPGYENLMISVNISSRQFSQPQLVSSILNILDSTGLNPHSLKLEITETSLMENPELAASILDQLDRAGVQLAMDDFGTGYSSLNYLRRFPVHTLKIDKSFVFRLGTQEEDLEIIRTIIALAHNLRMNVIAEGVENWSQLIQLRSLHCEFGQGYFFAKPLHPDFATSLVGEDPLWVAPL